MQSTNTFTRRGFLALGLGGMGMSLPGCTHRVNGLLDTNPIDHLREKVKQATVIYNGNLHAFPNDIEISGPDNSGIYTITSQKLNKVTRDRLQFDSSLDLITTSITITIDPLDILTLITLEKKFGLKNGDICSIAYQGNTFIIDKIKTPG